METRLRHRRFWPLIFAGSFPSLACLYVALFGAYGTESPFFPSFLALRKLSSADIGILLALATLMRLASGPVIGMLADVVGKRLVLAISAFGSGSIILVYLAGSGFWAMTAVATVHAVATAPLNPLADALALGAISRERSFPYGWVRGIGSAAFVVGTLASGLLVARFGLQSIIVGASILFFAMLLPLSALKPLATASVENVGGGIAVLLTDHLFRRMLIVAGLVIGSHAVSNTFAVIEWRAAGIGSAAISLLWSEAVASEIVGFLIVGPLLLAMVGIARCAMIAAAAGIVRWTVLGLTSELWALVATQLLHGLTFSLLHLVCMRVIAETVPERLEATAQTLYGVVALGVISAALTLVAGEAWELIGLRAYWIMAGLCVAAIPLASKLKVST